MTITIGKEAEVEAWLAAERKIKVVNAQPEGSYTTAQWAEHIGKCSVFAARKRLKKMFDAGIITRVHFRPGNQSGAAWAYFLKKEKKKCATS